MHCESGEGADDDRRLQPRRVGVSAGCEPGADPSTSAGWKTSSPSDDTRSAVKEIVTTCSVTAPHAQGISFTYR